MANEITTDNINTKAQEVASIGDGDYVYIFKTGAQGFSRIAASHFAQGGSGGNASKIKNIRDNKEYRLWVGTQAQLEALNGAYQSDVIYIVAQEVQGAEISITGISVSCSKSSATPNTYNLVATLSPSNTTQTSVEWIITSGNSYATLSSNGLTATLTVLPGASGNSVVVRCRSTENTSVSKDVTQNVTYEQPSVEVTITDINVSSTVLTNVMQCTAVFSPSGYTIPVTWNVSDTSIATINSDGRLTVKASGTVTVYANEFSKQISVTYNNESYDDDGLDFTATRTAPNTMTLAATNNGSSVNATFALSGNVPTVKKLQNGVLNDVPAVEISGNTLTYHDDCTVSVMATYGSNTQTKAITIAHNDSDYIWFEDDAMVAALNGIEIGSSGHVTYGQAASSTKVQLVNNADITRFNEFRLFTGITNLAYGGSTNRLDGNSNLICVQLPSSIDRITGNTSTQSPLYGTAITDLFIPDGTSLNAYALAGITSLETLSIAPPDASGFVASSCISGCDNLRKVIVRNTTQSLPSSAFQNHTSIEEVDLGENISELPNSCFRGCTGMTKLTMRYNGFVSFSTSAFYQFSDARLGTIDLYVPLSQVNTYKADVNYAKFKSINAITD